jgi:hypothetical protein
MNKDVLQKIKSFYSYIYRSFPRGQYLTNVQLIGCALSNPEISWFMVRAGVTPNGEKIISKVGKEKNYYFMQDGPLIFGGNCMN